MAKQFLVFYLLGILVLVLKKFFLGLNLPKPTRVVTVGSDQLFMELAEPKDENDGSTPS